MSAVTDNSNDLGLTHVMVNIETLGTSPGCVVLQIGAVAFNLDWELRSQQLESEHRFEVSVDVFSSMMHGMQVDPRTVEWWRGRDLPTQFNVMRAPVDLPRALQRLSDFLEDVKPDFLWAKGPQFYQTCLEAAYAAADLPPPWKYNQWLDLRTAWRVAEMSGFEIAQLKAIDSHLRK